MSNHTPSGSPRVESEDDLLKSKDKDDDSLDSKGSYITMADDNDKSDEDNEILENESAISSPDELESNEEGGVTITYFVETGVLDDPDADVPPWHDREDFLKFEHVYQIPEKGVWKENQIKDTNGNILPQDPQSFDNLIPREELIKHRPIERRLQLEDQKFTIMRTKEFQGSLFRAISRALTDSEDQHIFFRNQIIRYIESYWDKYLTDIIEYCGCETVLQHPVLQKPVELLANFRTKCLRGKEGCPEFFLDAAAQVFNCRVALVIIKQDLLDEILHGTLKEIGSFTDIENDTVFHFLRTGSHPETWFHELLMPIGRSISTLPRPGEYRIYLYDVLQIDRPRFSSVSRRVKRRGHHSAQFQRKNAKLFVGLDSKIYSYKPTISHDLWSILSELLYHKLDLAPQVFEATLRMKVEEMNYYHYSKYRKRREFKGHSHSKILRQRYKNSFKVPDMRLHRGGSQDLHLASEVLKFSYTLIGMDLGGNFFWRESIDEDAVTMNGNEDGHNEDPSGKHLCLFVKLNLNREPIWYALESFDFEKVDKLYGNMKFSHRTTSNQKIYFKSKADSDSRDDYFNESQWNENDMSRNSSAHNSASSPKLYMSQPVRRRDSVHSSRPTTLEKNLGMVQRIYERTMTFFRRIFHGNLQAGSAEVDFS